MYNYENLIERIDVLEGSINYKFTDKNNIILALTHSSFANEKKDGMLKSNERLEFLGDSVLNIIISEKIYSDYPQLNEGEMTKARASIVCEATLVDCANNINVGKYLLLGKGEETTGGRARVSILSDAFEALIGAVYLDGGIKNARQFVLNCLQDKIVDAINGVISLDYKTQLQEIIQRNSDKKIVYEIVDEKGPDHNKIFVAQLKVGDDAMGIGEGRSKKEAEQNAARQALEKYK